MTDLKIKASILMNTPESHGVPLDLQELSKQIDDILFWVQMLGNQQRAHMNEIKELKSKINELTYLNLDNIERENIGEYYYE
jgi:hypothetical protein